MFLLICQNQLYTQLHIPVICVQIKLRRSESKKIVYFEPYPQEEAKETLNSAGVTQIPFDGVTFNGYFRFMEVLR